MIKSLYLRHVGPAPELRFNVAPRLNILTGDNGLGKTFVLDVVWFLMTNSWVAERAFPYRPKAGLPVNGEAPAIMGKFGHRTEKSELEPETQFTYDAFTQGWNQQWHPGKIEAGPTANPYRTDEAALRPRSLVVYVRSDGGVSIWDGYRAPARISEFGKAAVQLTQEELWRGKRVRDNDGTNEKVLCKGLIDDWVYWRNENGRSWNFLLRALNVLSPPQEPLVPGDPVSLHLDEDRLIPTLELPYGIVPLTITSAGMQRVLGIAYGIVWAWTRHLQAAEAAGVTPLRDMVVLIDEVELHLHPQWQRVIVPAILKAISAIAPNVAVQMMLSTHSPLVMASLEATFEEEHDNLFHFQLDGTVVSTEEIGFAKQGDASMWLASESFGLPQPRSIESEHAINAAMAFMEGDHTTANSKLELLGISPQMYRTKKQRQEVIHQMLRQHVPGHDDFWPTWIVTAMRRGKAGT